MEMNLPNACKTLLRDMEVEKIAAAARRIIRPVLCCNDAENEIMAICQDDDAMIGIG